MNCRRCGFELDENWSVCPKCYQAVKDDVTNKNNQPNINENTQPKPNLKFESKQGKSNYLRGDEICIKVFLLFIALGAFVKQVDKIAFSLALITLIYGHIKYPENGEMRLGVRVLFMIIVVAGIAAVTIFPFVFFLKERNFTVSP